MTRVASVDIMRTIAILVMVQTHFFENLAPPLPQDSFYQILHFLYELIAAPTFTFLVGLSFSMSLQNSLINGHSLTYIRNRGIKKGIYIFLIGLLFGVMIWSLKEMLDWDILTLIGSSIIYLAFTFKKHTIKFHAVFAFLILIITPHLQNLIQYSSAWNNEGSVYLSSFDWIFILKGFFLRGFFPLFPWLIFPIIGFVCGQSFINKAKFHKPHLLLYFGLALLTFGCSLMLIGIIFGDHGVYNTYVTNWTVAYSKYPATTSYIIASLGLTMSALALVEKVRSRLPQHLLYIAQIFSKYSLTIYVLHHAIHLWPLWAYGYAQNHNNKSHYLSHLTDFYSALALGVICLVSIHYILKEWEKKNGKYSLEWFLKHLI